MLFSGNLRRDYELLHTLEKTAIELGKSKDSINKMTKSIKEGIRNTNRERERWEKEEIYKWRPYHNNWDSRYCRIEYEGIPTEEERKNYIDEEWEHWYNPYNDGRDCTGVWFTWNICVFPIPALDKTVVYHFQNMDV